MTIIYHRTRIAVVTVLAYAHRIVRADKYYYYVHLHVFICIIYDRTPTACLFFITFVFFFTPLVPFELHWLPPRARQRDTGTAAILRYAYHVHGIP